MISLNKSQVFWLTFRQLICLILSIGMVLIGLPVMAGDKETIVKVKFVPGGPRGGPRGYDPYKYFQIRAKAYNAEGEEVKCNMYYPPPRNPFNGKVNVIEHIDQESGWVKMGSERGPAQVLAFCLDKPKIKARMLVMGNGGKGPFEPTEIRSWLESPPPPLSFSKSQRKYLAQAKKIAAPTPASPPPTKKTASKRSGKEGALAIGAGVALGAALVGAMALSGGGSGGSS